MSAQNEKGLQDSVPMKTLCTTEMFLGAVVTERYSENTENAARASNLCVGHHKQGQLII